MKLVEAQFVGHPQANEQGNRQADAEARNIEQAETFVAPKGAQCDF